jgi:hypothetical protein
MNLIIITTTIINLDHPSTFSQYLTTQAQPLRDLIPVNHIQSPRITLSA